jgi:hypothetical protein
MYDQASQRREARKNQPLMDQRWNESRSSAALSSFSPVDIEAQRVTRQKQKDLSSISRVRSLTGSANIMGQTAQMFGGNNVAATKTMTGM